MASVQLIQAVAVTAELCGRVFTEAAARVFVDDLSGFDEALVMAALARCRREVRGVLTTQDVVSRIDDGRPGPDEAWASIPHDEAQSVVWTDEMAKAWGIAMSAPDRTSQRLAFREAYQAEVARARDAGRRPNWTASLGHDQRQRESAIRDALDRGRIGLEYAREFMPAIESPKMLAIAGKAIGKPRALTLVEGGKS